jgi:diacylglycerol kinase family enzyme
MRWIDLGWVNGTHFFNVASVGLSVLVARRLTQQVKRRWGLLGYLHCLWEVAHRVSDFSVSILCDGSVEQRRSLQVAVGNGRFYGGGMVIMDDASIDDGRLDIYSLDPQPRWRLIVLFPALLRGGHRQVPGVFTERGEHVRLETDPPRSINIDGEIRARTPAEFRVVPHALRVFAPRRGG